MLTILVSVEEAHIIEVLQFPYTYTHIVTAGEKNVSVDRHGSDGVEVPAELRYMIVRPDVPDVDLLVTPSDYYVTMASLLLLGLGRVLGICIELEAEDLTSHEEVFFFLNISTAIWCGHASLSLFRDLSIVDDHFQLWEDCARQHGVCISCFFLRDLPNRYLTVVASTHQELRVLMEGAQNARD